MPGADQMAKAGCGPMIVTTWRSDEVPGGLVRETTDQMCRDNRYPPGSDAIVRKVRETLLESFEASGSATGPRPIQPAAGIAPILPLPVPSSLPDQQSSASTPATVPAAPAAVPGVDRRVFDPNMRSGAPRAPSATPSPAAPAPASRAAKSITVPSGTTIPVMTSGLISAATNRPGDRFRGAILQAVVVNGVAVIAGNAAVTLEVVAAGEGLTVRLVDLTSNGGTVAASSSQVTLDPQVAAGNDVIERAMVAAGANPRGAAMQKALAARLVVVSGARLNLPSGTRLAFTLAAPLTIEGPGLTK